MNHVTGGVRTCLRLEGAAALAAALYLYAHGGYSWGMFALLILAPDLSFAGYLGGVRAGTIIYDAAHSYIGPLVLGVASLALGWLPAVALIWIAHIGVDRMIGYGLKYAAGFQDTHLGTIGRRDGRRTAPLG